jgi:hypothetical protein
MELLETARAQGRREARGRLAVPLLLLALALPGARGNGADADAERPFELKTPLWPNDKAPASISPRSGKHWAFEPARKSSPPFDPASNPAGDPAVNPGGEGTSPIDLFIRQKLRAEGLHPVPPANPSTLCRRLFFDLTGLPPSPEELQAFLDDPAPDAFEQLADKLLASPRYGERWGRHWMDVVRYADTAGDNADYPIPEARLYRDYIIGSFNADKPYDRFLEEQLAGDLLAGEASATSPEAKSSSERHAERISATGFLALSRRYGTGPYELWHLTLEDTIETVGRAFLGLTLRCARCHDHKYDPVTKEDYYALYGIFASTQYPWAGSEEVASKQLNRMNFVPLVPPGEALPRLEAHEKRLKELREEVQRLEKEGPPAAERLKAKRGDLRNLEKIGLPPDLPGAYAVREGQPVDADLQVQGDPENKGPVVKRDVPAFLSAGKRLEIPPGHSGRLELARWLTRPEHPLTARVMVNRIWQHHFGKGIVATPSNFGLRGDEPTHPELLDWLAARFVESGWSVKALHRLILSSKTYRLSSAFDAANAQRDPGNRLYWRFDRRRLEAEAIRDALMAASGDLDLSFPGPHPFPTAEKWTWTQHAPFKEVYPSSHRSVYLMTQRLQRHPFLGLFDEPDTNTSTEARSSSTVPLQALYLLNNPLVAAEASKLAARLRATSSDEVQRIRFGILLAWSREPGEGEVEKMRSSLARYRDGLEQTGRTKEEEETEVWTSYARVLLEANEFVYVD